MTPEQAINYLTLNKPSSGYPGLCEAIDMAIAALRDRPAPPDALVANLNVRHDEALHTAIGWMSQEENLVTTREALIELLMMLKPVIFAAPAPVAAPAPEPGQCGLCGERDGQHGQWCQMRKPAPETHAKCNGQGIECLGCAACETPAPDAMPEAQVDDVIVREVTDSVRRVDGLGWAYLRDGAVWIGSGDASICRFERNGVVIWRRQEAQP